MGVGLRRYIDFLILLIPTPLVSVLFCSSIPTFLFIFKNVFRSCSSTFFKLHFRYRICRSISRFSTTQNGWSKVDLDLYTGS